LPGTKLDRKAEEFVMGVHFGKLATVNRDGSPQLTPVWYLYERGLFVINTATDRLKYRNIRRDPRVALLIDEGYSYVAVKGNARIARERDGNKDIETLAIRYLGEERGRKQARELYWKQKRVTIEIEPLRVLCSLP
jgi:PPOX class probable F420-dependent enzyme